ncbi:protein AGENET DOMAIN (AGD)-CONTAINING P1-like [Actinidia eriantha]|uniref:protein AGENET DOMAIN (AGD)-CONTAINING P1-like n=1 Tax=Actinidia eriantha TaxID=165200 RepID=UPI002587BAFE|nr:protein AGENET DOMAIN (AGD)-CONTAINING P1-like [Actinidia eriantha]
MPTAHFQKGDKVEVRGGDDSSRRLQGTVLRSSPAKHKGMIYVECENLAAEKSWGKGRRASRDRVGSVADIFENSRYSVPFVGVVEESAFEQWNLRLHRDWDDGSWIPPFDSQIKPRALKLRIKFSGRTSDANFSKETVVEVRSDKEAYQGSWYTAFIVDSIGTDKFLVEYQTLRADDETELLKENVDGFYIRPSPPEIPQINRFKQFQEVDAWHNGGSWVGLIFEVLDDHKYLVYLMGANGEMTVEHSELRPHQ